MTFKPAHKDTDTPPGQVVNPIDRSKTIGGIIDRVLRANGQPVKQKLTFDEWWHLNNDDSFYYEASRRAWKAAQENV